MGNSRSKLWIVLSIFLLCTGVVSLATFAHQHGTTASKIEINTDKKNQNTDTARFQAPTTPPILVEVFTAPSCSPITEEYVNDDGTYKAPRENDKKYNKKLATKILEELMSENPNVIGLNYHKDPRRGRPNINYATEIKQSSNTIKTFKDVDFQRLNSFINEHKSHYNKTINTLVDDYTGNTTFINGAYKTEGTMRPIVDAAIRVAKTEHPLKPVGLFLSSDKEKITIAFPPLHQTLKTPLKIKLIGYFKELKKDDRDTFRTLQPTNIVSDYKYIEAWDGTEETRVVNVSNMDADHFAIIFYNPKTNHIFAAGKTETSLPNQIASIQK